MPDVRPIGKFDQFATWVSDHTSRAWFFAFCLIIIIIWAPSLIFLEFDAWNFAINTTTTIVTFLLVALLQNSQRRSEIALQTKLNVMAKAQRDLMDHVAHQPCEFEDCDLAVDIGELEQAIGLEEQVGTKQE